MAQADFMVFLKVGWVEGTARRVQRQAACSPKCRSYSEGMTIRYTVAVADYLTEAEQELKVLSDVADVELLLAKSEEQLLAAAGTFDALLVYHSTKITDRSIAGMTRCKGIVRCGVGYDNVDIRAAGSRGIVVC